MRGHWKFLYYFSLKLSARLGGEVKSLTGGHYAAKRISLRQTSTVIHYCVIQKYIRKECLTFQCLRESIKDNQVAQRNHRYLGDKNHVSKEKICIFGTSDFKHLEQEKGATHVPLCAACQLESKAPEVTDPAQVLPCILVEMHKTVWSSKHSTIYIS